MINTQLFFKLKKTGKLEVELREDDPDNPSGHIKVDLKKETRGMLIGVFQPGEKLVNTIRVDGVDCWLLYNNETSKQTVYLTIIFAPAPTSPKKVHKYLVGFNPNVFSNVELL